MKIKRISPYTGRENEMDLPISEKQINDYVNGMLIQNAFPNLTATEREFIKTGYTQEDWDAIFPPEKHK